MEKIICFLSVLYLLFVIFAIVKILRSVATYCEDISPINDAVKRMDNAEIPPKESVKQAEPSNIIDVDFKEKKRKELVRVCKIPPGIYADLFFLSNN